MAPKLRAPGFANQALEMSFQSFVQFSTAGAPDCSSNTMNGMIYSMDYIRFLDVCRIDYNSSITPSNELSRVSLDEFKFEKAIKGLYRFQFEIPGYDSKNQTQQSFIDSKVSTITALNTAPKSWKLGQVFSDPPEILVLDSENKPLVNKTVIAFTWPESTFGKLTNNYNLDARKFALLSHKEVKTNGSGIAVFKNLTI